MHQRRHEAVRVDAEILGRDVLTSAGIEVMACPGECLFLQGHAHSHGAIGPARMVEMQAPEFEHGFVSLVLIIKKKG